MSNPVRIFLLLLLLLLGTAGPCLPVDSGIKISFVLSGKFLVSIGYIQRVTAGTAAEVSLFTTPEGRPFGFYVGALGDVAAEQRWSPYGGLGLSVLVNRGGQQRFLPFFRATGGFAYRPHENLSHNAEAWMAYLPASRKVRPVGIGMSHVNGF